MLHHQGDHTYQVVPREQTLHLQVGFHIHITLSVDSLTATIYQTRTKPFSRTLLLVILWVVIAATMLLYSQEEVQFIQETDTSKLK